MTEAATIDRSLQPREYALIPIVAAIGILLVYDVPYLGLPLAALVLGRLVYAGSQNLAIVAVVLAAVGSVAYGIVRPIMVAPSLGAIIWAARANAVVRPWKIVAALTLVVAVTYGASVALDARITGGTIGDEVVRSVDLTIETMDATLDTAQADPADRAAYRDLRDMFRTVLLQVVPSIMLVSFFVAGGLVMSSLARMSAAHGSPVSGYRPLRDFTAPIHVVLALAAGLGLTAWVLYTDAEGTVLGAVALNTLVLSASVVMLQGLAVADSLMRRIRMGPILRLVAYVAAFLTSTLAPVVAVLGTAEFWMDLRKLRSGDDPDGDTAPTFDEGPDVPSEDPSDGGVE